MGTGGETERIRGTLGRTCGKEMGNAECMKKRREFKIGIIEVI